MKYNYTKSKYSYIIYKFHIYLLIDERRRLIMIIIFLPDNLKEDLQQYCRYGKYSCSKMR